MMACAVLVACMGVRAATFERTIEAPNGVGDVVALTNALTELNTTYDYKTTVRIWLQPGTYDLSGVQMSSSDGGKGHLVIEAYQGGIFAGLGDGPEDTILLGGGEAGNRRVMYSKGGGNYGYFTVSNLTVTGGWTAGDGGGICGTHSTAYRNLIVSNNYAIGSSNGTGGGGCYSGVAYNCLFADNHCTARWGGGFLVSGYSTRNETIGQGAWNCVFVDNTASSNGGGLACNGGGQCHNCAFTNNTAASGGGVYFYKVDYATFNGSARTSCVANCTFTGNSGGSVGGALDVDYAVAQRTVPVTNCVFRSNAGNFAVRYGDMVDCVMECNTNAVAVVCNSPMNRCVLRGNAVQNRYSTAIDYAGSSFPLLTNVNCLVESNFFLQDYGKLFSRKHYVNCTIIGNSMPSGNKYGYLSEGCVFHNCVLAGNKISESNFLDVRTVAYEGAAVAVTMTNCVFSASDVAAGEIGADGTVSHAGLFNCRKIDAANLKFANAAGGDYTPTTRSHLYNAGLASDWIIALVGAEDLAGNARVFDRGIDIGAYECQRNPPGIILIVE